MSSAAPNQSAPAGPDADAPIMTARQAIDEEFRRLGIGGRQPTALCLSGGGIRSAAFCLGVIQALAKHKLLTEFNYLSTVSGGGYAGSWLTRLIAQRSEGATNTPDMAALQEEIAAPVDRAEREAVSGLRRYSSYLTPNRGFASLDTWAGITLWLRNTLINWFVFLPVFGALAGLPIFFVAATYAVAEKSLEGPGTWATHAAYAGAVALFIAVLGSIVYLPSHAHPDDGDGPREAYGLTGSEVFARIVVPIVLWCLLAAASAAPRAPDPGWATEGRAIFTNVPALSCTLGTCDETRGEAIEQIPQGAPDRWRPERHLPIVGFLTCLAAYAGAFLWTVWKYRGNGDLRRKHMAPFGRGIVPWLLSSLLSSLFLSVGIWLVQDRSLLWVALAGPVWVAIGETLRTTLYVAMRSSGLRSDSDREWLARVNGSKLRIVLGMAAGGTVAVLGGSYLGAQGGAVWTSLIGGGAASGSIVALIGSSARTSFLSQVAHLGGGRTEGQDGVASKLSLSSTYVVNGAIVLFGCILFALIGRGLARLAGITAEALTRCRAPDFATLALVSLALTIGLGVAAFLLGRVINLNRFSMHAVYRNRLIRAFLGSGRSWADRRPDRFTQFDPRDNIRMVDTFTGERSFLFPVVNVALNRTTGRDTARAERKAESFTITPLRCGAATLPSADTPSSAGGTDRGDRDNALPIPTDNSPRNGAYAPTCGYAAGERDTGVGDKERGITLGTAITISGAAASPNMGYHSSPLTAFVMTLFNVRLGAWLPNPAMRRTIAKERWALLKASGPRNEVPTLLQELIGRSDTDGDFLYLSDGGHFDNLGVYEMLRRRCRLIVAVDAGQDKDYAYEDLARLKQNVQIDLGVTITFTKPITVKERVLAPQGALATIRYPQDGDRPEATGHLLYLKSWLPADSPVELAAYRLRNIDFPHESTGNQFFTESDFESYRHLGNYLADAIFAAPTSEAGTTGPGPKPPNTPLGEVFDRLSPVSKPKADDRSWWERTRSLNP